MRSLKNLQPDKVFKYFEEISSIPRGSTNMDAISSYCMEFAEKHSLRAIRDEANNVIIFKDASEGYENSEPIILQGHLDMVCQKTEDSDIDFETDGLKIYTDGDLLKAEGTTLGADNGIAVSMILAILSDNSLSHPPIEAVFTTDEEIGMVGAFALSTDSLKGKRMINLDSEEQDILTVSCAGGSDFRMTVPFKKNTVAAEKVELVIKGLKGGHSGVEINSGRVNANMLAGRILNYAKSIADFDIISINGGDKANAIPLLSTIQLATENADDFIAKLTPYIETIKTEIAEREEGFAPSLKNCGKGEYEVIDKSAHDKVLFTLIAAPNGVMEMSASIEALVETSLNLGILKTEQDKIIMHFALRSNKKSALAALEEKLFAFTAFSGIEAEAFGHYPPWEFRENSELQRVYKEIYKSQFGKVPTVSAIHAGLECGVFAAKIDDFDCISIGPEMWDVHTVNERLSISSTIMMFELILKLLETLR